ncbi:MAG: hypothetical protein K6T86_14905 [Pirellulales bacterium]|nr:hypothetical protein [Pirellulales bacterium]
MPLPSEWEHDDWDECEPTPEDLLADPNADVARLLWDALDDEAPEPEAGDFWLPDDESYD